jgi:anaerobic selenocysteine-containing dehydrogenase
VSVHYTTCNICEATCGLRVHVEGTRVTRIEPDTEHVASQGYACVKGLKIHEVHHSPDRLQYPQKRMGDRFVRISWDQALREIGAKTRQLRQEHGANALSVYLGNPISFNFLAPMLAAGFAQGLGTKNFFQTGSQDCNNKFVVAQRMYGFPFVQPYPDVDRTSLLICVGSNPAVSRMSFIHLPDPVRRLKAIERRGGKVVFVNPRRTESARQLGEHVFIRPDTDVFFYLSFLHEVLQHGVNRAHVHRTMSGFGELEALAAGWTPEQTAAVTGIDASVLRGLVRDYLAADGAALFCSTGVNQGSHGTLAFWLQEVINAITGNLDRRGGTLVGQPIVPDLMRLLRKAGNTMRSDRSRVGDLPSCVDSFPAGIMADEILTKGPGQVRALFVFSGNPVLSVPNAGGRLTQALRELELLVTVDIFRTETGSWRTTCCPAPPRSAPQHPLSCSSRSWGRRPRPSCSIRSAWCRPRPSSATRWTSCCSWRVRAGRRCSARGPCPHSCRRGCARGACRGSAPRWGSRTSACWTWCCGPRSKARGGQPPRAPARRAAASARGRHLLGRARGHRRRPRAAGPARAGGPPAGPPCGLRA